MFEEKYCVGPGDQIPTMVFIVPNEKNSDFFLNDNSPIIQIEAEDANNLMGNWKLTTNVSTLQLQNVSKVYSSYGDAIFAFTKMKNYLTDICENMKKIGYLERTLERARNDLDDNKNTFYLYSE